MTDTAAPYLMVDPVHDTAIPVAFDAFTFMSAPRSRVMARHATALFLRSDGAVLHLNRAEPKSRTPLTTLKLRLGQPVPATHFFEQIEMPLDDFKVMLLDCAVYMRDAGRRGKAWWLSTAPMAEVQACIHSADDFAALHKAIPMSRAETQEALK